MTSNQLGYPWFNDHRPPLRRTAENTTRLGDLCAAAEHGTLPRDDDGLHLAQKDEHHDLVGGIATPLKNMGLSIGMMTFPIYRKIKAMFQLPPTR